MDKRKFLQADNEDDLMALKDYQRLLEAGSAGQDGTIKFNYPTFIERYFTKHYMLDVKHANNDHLILIHSNKVAVIALAPTHTLLVNKDKYKLDRVEFVQQVSEEMSGKHKHNAKNVNFNQPICKLHCRETDETVKSFVVYACLNAKLAEINENIVKNPQLLIDKPDTEGHIAILIPRLESLKEQCSLFKTHEEFLKIKSC